MVAKTATTYHRRRRIRKDWISRKKSVKKPALTDHNTVQNIVMMGNCQRVSCLLWAAISWGSAAMRPAVMYVMNQRASICSVCSMHMVNMHVQAHIIQ